MGAAAAVGNGVSVGVCDAASLLVVAGGVLVVGATGAGAIGAVGADGAPDGAGIGAAGGTPGGVLITGWPSILPLMKTSPRVGGPKESVGMG